MLNDDSAPPCGGVATERSAALYERLGVQLMRRPPQLCGDATASAAGL
jgi:hypothetical protein